MKTDLLFRLPLFMQKYDELVKLTDSQNPEFDLLWDAEALARRNVFIYTAGDEGLKRFERMLGITPEPGESIESRRNQVLMRWNNNQPFTFRFLVGLLEVMTDGNFEIYTNFDNYEMEIVVFDMEPGILTDLDHIRQIIPANIVLKNRLQSICEIKGKINNATALIQTIEIKI